MPDSSVNHDFLSGKFGRLNYKPVLNTVSKPMAANMTKAEKIVWFQILSSKKTGYKFLKQKIIQNFIVDFYCSELLPVIEIDDISHESKISQDIARDKFLEKMNVKVLRVRNEEVYRSVEEVSQKILNTINSLAKRPQSSDNASESSP